MTNYAEMNIKELRKLANEAGIKGTSKMEKAVLIAALNNLPEKDTAEAPAGTYAINAMRQAIIAAYNTGNKKAIDQTVAEAGGATKERFDQWVQWVNDLRETAVNYNRVIDNKDSSTKERASAKGRLFAQWRKIIKVGEENLFHPNMFVREEDAEIISGFARTFTTTSVVKVFAPKSEMIFRKEIETFLGIRISGNAMLNDSERDTLKDYYAAKKTLASADKMLNGETTENKHTPGIEENIISAKKDLEIAEKMLVGMGVKEEEIPEHALTATYRVKIAEFEAAKKQAEKSRKEAQATIDKLKLAAEAIEAKIKPITYNA